MIATKDSLLNAALQLDVQDRAELAQRLLDSLPPGVDPVPLMDPEVKQAWSEEVQRRWEMYQRGEMESIDGEEALQRILARYEP